MKAAPRYLGRAGGEVARDRLTQFVRYANLVAEQEAALEDGDLDRFEELADSVTELRGMIGAARAAETPEDEHEQAEEVLREALAANLRIQTRLQSMRGQDAARIRSIAHRRPQARRYVSEEADPPVSHLDLTL